MTRCHGRGGDRNDDRGAMGFIDCGARGEEMAVAKGNERDSTGGNIKHTAYGVSLLQLRDARTEIKRCAMKV
jgi:hypothetical protein